MAQHVDVLASKVIEKVLLIRTDIVMTQHVDVLASKVIVNVLLIRIAVVHVRTVIDNVLLRMILLLHDRLGT